MTKLFVNSALLKLTAVPPHDALQDAANLAWKVALVVAGEAAAGHELLDTYQEERWPVGADVIRRTGQLHAHKCQSIS